MVEKGLYLADGLVYKSKKFIFNPDAKYVKNPHLLLVGGSGAGKTTLMLKILENASLEGKTVFLIDFHGDMMIDSENHIKYTPRNSPYGINPFELEMSEESGGVDMQAEVVAIMMDTYFFDKMGKKQQSIMKRLIIDLYASKGIHDNDHTTWINKPPTMKELNKLIQYVHSEIEILENSDDITITRESDKQIARNAIVTIKNILIKNSKEETRYTNAIKTLSDEIDTLKETRNGFSSIDISFYAQKTNKRSFESLFPYIDEVSRMSIFNGEKPRITSGINRLDFSAFTAINKPNIARFLAEFTAQKIFRASMNSGTFAGHDGIKFRWVLAFDESKLALPSGREKSNPYNIMNRIVTEARKYGLALFLASQRLEHYNDELLANIYTKIILDTKASDIVAISKAMGVHVDIVKQTFSSATAGLRPALIDSGGVNSYIIRELTGGLRK